MKSTERSIGFKQPSQSRLTSFHQMQLSGLGKTEGLLIRPIASLPLLVTNNLKMKRPVSPGDIK